MNIFCFCKENMRLLLSLRIKLLLIREEGRFISVFIL